MCLHRIYLNKPKWLKPRIEQVVTGNNHRFTYPCDYRYFEGGGEAMKLNIRTVNSHNVFHLVIADNVNAFLYTTLAQYQQFGSRKSKTTQCQKFQESFRPPKKYNKEI